MRPISKPSIVGAGLVVAWVLTTGSGYLLLGAYENKPGSPGSPPDRWPSGARARLDPRLPTLVVFLHPRCPCSGASVAELAAIEERCRGRFAIRAVICRPERSAEGWEVGGEVGSGLAAMPGLERVIDPGGREGLRFGVETSGHVLLYSTDGRLLFSGGITASRGHRGESRGAEALVGLVTRATGGQARPPVFGCRVIGPARPAGAGGGT